MSSTNFQIGVNESNSSRVLKPPGGGSSDIFGASESVLPTPRVVRQQMQSTLFTNSQQNGSAVNGAVNGSQQRTKSAANGSDSHNRLFGADPRVANTPSKNHMRSNIPFGQQDSVDNGVAQSPHQNGHFSTTPTSPTGTEGNSTNGDMPRHSESNSVANSGTNGYSGKRVPPGGFSSGLW